MPRRSPSLVDSLLLKPWWVSAAIGVALSLLSLVFVGSLASRGDAFSQGFAKAGQIVPVGILVFFSFVSAGAALMGYRRRDLIQSQTSISTIRDLSWTAFESLVAEAYRRQGYQVEQPLSGGSDGGVDLVLHRNGETTLVQCKQWRTSSVGAPVIREIFGVQTHERAHGSIVVTSGNFTREAVAFADGKSMTLVEGHDLLKLIRGVQTERKSSSLPTSKAPDATTLCPKCGSPMIRRVARKGANAGKAFWGCTTYPQCTGTRPA